MSAMVEDLVQKTRNQDLTQLLKRYRINRILLGIEKGEGLAWIICENPTITNLSYRITLNPARSLFDLIEDLGHELGHLIAWQDFNSVPIFKKDEEFAEMFCKRWARETSNQIQAKKILTKLLKYNEVIL